MVFSNSFSFATKCLYWQYEQLMRSPVDGVNAAPLESNMFEWHGNFYFKEDHEHFPAMVVHFIMEFPVDYPNAKPSMRLLNTFNHSHVFRHFICFSPLLEDGSDGFPDTAFWNPARTIRSLLESVYTFLTVDEDRYVRITKGRAREDLQRARTVCCRTCGHNAREGMVWPPEEAWMAALMSISKLEDQVCALAMHEDLAVQETPAKKGTITRYPTLPAKADMAHNSTQTLRDKVDERLSILKVKVAAMVTAQSPSCSTRTMDQDALEDFRCSVTGVAFDDSENVVLGFGVNVTRRKHDGTILSITTDLMPISMKVFYKGKLRKSALGAPITHFFPFAINDAHWTKAKRVLTGCVNAILADSKERGLGDSPNKRLLFVIGELWKSMAVLMMKGEAHTSEKVLKGFCALHHILLLVADEEEPIKSRIGIVDNVDSRADEKKQSEEMDPLTHETNTDWIVVAPKKKPKPVSVLGIVETCVGQFVRMPHARHKSRCPDFGRFLPLILLSDLSWDEIKEPFIDELMARNSSWIVNYMSDLRRVPLSEWTRPSHRADISWRASATGLRLTAFQIRFALNCLSWATEALSKPAVAEYQKLGGQRLAVRVMYNKLGGRPTKTMLATFQEEAKAIRYMNCYQKFFNLVGMELDEMQIQQRLCKAMLHSEKCGYHY